MSLKLPSFPFYPGDWLRDNVAGCSLAAQGLWLRMMMLMHDSERYGYLCENGSPMQPVTVARRCGCDLAEYETLFAELAHAGVPSTTTNGIIFSRRMSRDAIERLAASNRKKRSRIRHACVTEDVTPLSEVENETEIQALELYELYPRKVGKPNALKSIRRALANEQFQVLLEAVTAYSKAREGEDEQYTPHPATWFNQERWKDDRRNWRTSAAGKNAQSANGKARVDSAPAADGTSKYSKFKPVAASKPSGDSTGPVAGQGSGAAPGGPGAGNTS